MLDIVQLGPMSGVSFIVFQNKMKVTKSVDFSHRLFIPIRCVNV